MIPEIKYLHSPDIDKLESYSPKVHDNFSFLLQAMIGPMNEQGKESFDIKVCTPKWLLENNKAGDILVGRHYLIVFKYDYKALLAKLEKLVHACSGEDWNECAQKLSRIGHWEFEDYLKHNKFIKIRFY